MIRKIKQLESNYDGLPLEVLVIRPTKPPRGVIVMHHGMCEHKERYTWMMEQMARSGYACVMADMRGHGASVMKAADLGFLYDSHTAGVIRDFHQVAYYARELFPDIPVILYGHSMGALVTADYLKAHDFGVSAVILSGMPCRNKAAGSAEKMVDVLSRIKGKNSKSRLMYNMSLAGYDKMFKNERKKNGWLAVDPAVADAYDADELSGFPFTLDGYRTLVELMQEVFDKDGWDVTNPDLPILMIAGGTDPVAGLVTGFRDSVHFLRGRGYDRVRGKIYANYRHEIHNDYCRDQVVRDLKAWLYQSLFK